MDFIDTHAHIDGEEFDLDRDLARDGKGWLKLYLPARSACVLRMTKD